MSGKSIALCLLALMVTTTACERKRVRDPRNKNQVSGKGQPGKPQMTNLHKPEECPAMMDGAWVAQTGETLTLGKDAQGQITLKALEEKDALPVNGIARFTDTQMSYAYCSDKKLIYSFESGATVAEPTRKVDITFTTADILSGQMQIQITTLAAKRKVEKVGEVQTLPMGRPAPDLSL